MDFNVTAVFNSRRDDHEQISVSQKPRHPSECRGFSNSIYFTCEFLQLLAAQVYTPENALYPPSTGSTMPVTKLAARSSTRKSIAPISSLSSP